MVQILHSKFRMSKQYTTEFIVLVTECIVLMSTGSCLMYKFNKAHLWCHNIESRNECKGDIEIDSFRSNYGVFDFDKLATMWSESNHCIITTITLSIHIQREAMVIRKRHVVCVSKRCFIASFFNQSESIERVHCRQHWQFFNWNRWITIELVWLYLSNRANRLSTNFEWIYFPFRINSFSGIPHSIPV